MESDYEGATSMAGPSSSAGPYQPSTGGVGAIKRNSGVMWNGAAVENGGDPKLLQRTAAVVTTTNGQVSGEKRKTNSKWHLNDYYDHRFFCIPVILCV